MGVRRKRNQFLCNHFLAPPPECTKEFFVVAPPSDPLFLCFYFLRLSLCSHTRARTNVSFPFYFILCHQTNGDEFDTLDTLCVCATAVAAAASASSTRRI